MGNLLGIYDNEFCDLRCKMREWRAQADDILIKQENLMCEMSIHGTDLPKKLLDTPL